MPRSSKIAATLAAILAVSLASAGAAVAQSNNPSINDYQESAPGADGSLGGGGGGAGTGGGSGQGSGGSANQATQTPAAVVPDSGSAPATSTPASSASGGSANGGSANGGGSGQGQSGGSAGGSGSGSATAASQSAQADSSSGPGDLVEGVTSAFGTGSDETGLGIFFPLLIVALVGASAVVLIRRRRES